MGKFKITVARIELAGRGSQVRITFQVEGAPTCFQVPILLDIGDFDDTEMVQAAEAACTERSSSSRPKAKSGS